MALLVYLAVNSGAVPERRSRLLPIFWPEVDSERSRNSLRQSLYLLRQALGDGVVVTRGDEEVAVDPAVLWCDTTAFSVAITEGRLEEALQLYRGDFLQGLSLSDAPAFEHWASRTRMRYREQAAAAAATLASARFEAGDDGGAVRWAHQAVRLAWGDEVLARRMLSLLAAAGDRVGALRAYDAFREDLWQEYEVEPDDETQALIAGIRAAGERVPPSPAPPPGPAPGVGADPPAPPSTAVAEPAPPGRGRPRRWLVAGIAALLVAFLGVAGRAFIGAGKAPAGPQAG